MDGMTGRRQGADERGPARLGRYIEQVRLSRGLKQGELAAKAGVNPSYLSSIEAGQRKWPETVMSKVARALGVHEAFFAYEAGIISDDPALLQASCPIRADDPRAEVVDLLPGVADEDVPIVLGLVKRLASETD